MSPPPLDRRVDFIASRSYYLQHLIPVWKALPEEVQGGFFIPKGLGGWGETIKAAQQADIPFVVVPDFLPVALEAEGPLVSAGYVDVKWSQAVTRGRPLILMEHGAGQTYKDAWHEGSLPGRGVDQITDLQLLPGEAMAPPEMCASKVVGSPRVEELQQKFAGTRVSEPVVAVSFHWECHVVPETYSAWPYFWSGLRELAQKFKVLGHGHPRILPMIKPIYEDMGIEVVWNFEEVLERAAVFACDNSSTMYEFAATGRPVVVLNAPWFRRNVQHGLRFWGQSGVGIQCDKPFRLTDSVREALEELDSQVERRQEAVAQVYDLRPGAAIRAAAAIAERIE